MNNQIGLVLTQIVTQQQIGFRHFEVIAGLTGPVAVLLYPRTQAWGTWDARITRY
jgi:hypothetical protein